jgi:aminoglycoside 6'-N-acetyltransferase I
LAFQVKLLSAGDAALLRGVAPGVFDDPIDEQKAREFLHDPRHHLVVAIEDDAVVAFASGVHYVHPDKTHPELWINEVAVAPTYHRRGIGKAVVQALLDHGRSLGCAEAWVATDVENKAANELYRSLRGNPQSPDTVIYAFKLHEG